MKEVVLSRKWLAMGSMIIQSRLYYAGERKLLAFLNNEKVVLT